MIPGTSLSGCLCLQRLSQLAESLDGVGYRGLMGYDGGEVGTAISSAERLHAARDAVEAGGTKVGIISGAGSENYWVASTLGEGESTWEMQVRLPSLLPHSSSVPQHSSPVSHHFASFLFFATSLSPHFSSLQGGGGVLCCQKYYNTFKDAEGGPSHEYSLHLMAQIVSVAGQVTTPALWHRGPRRNSISTRPVTDLMQSDSKAHAICQLVPALSLHTQAITPRETSDRLRALGQSAEGRVVGDAGFKASMWPFAGAGESDFLPIVRHRDGLTVDSTSAEHTIFAVDDATVGSPLTLGERVMVRPSALL